MKSASVETDFVEEAIAVVDQEDPSYRIVEDDKLYEVRANCQVGSFMKGSNRKLTDKVEFILVSVTPYWGDLGMTQQAAWLQLKYIPLPGFGLPRTICVTYIKEESLDILSDMKTELKSGMFRNHPEAPELYAESLSEGVVTARFDGRSGDGKNWFVVKFGFRNFASDKESAYAKRAIAYGESKNLMDLRGTQGMIAVKDFVEKFGPDAMESLRSIRAAHGLSMASALRVIRDGETIESIVKELAPAQAV